PIGSWGASRAYAVSLSRGRRLLRVLSSFLSLERSRAFPGRQDSARADGQDHTALRRDGGHAAAAAALHGTRGHHRHDRQLLDLCLAALAMPRARTVLGKRRAQRPLRPRTSRPRAASARAAGAQTPAAERLTLPSK